MKHELVATCYLVLLLLLPKNVTLKTRMMHSSHSEMSAADSIATQIDPDELIASLREDPPKHRPLAGHDNTTSHRVYSGRYQAAMEIPKFKLPETGTGSHSIYQLIKDELDLDGRPNLNLASFVSQKLM